VDEFDMLIVAAADPFWQQHDDGSWNHESVVIELEGKFINSLPKA
jgi:predicted NUDIX family NTP pyrophosphohydrolase